MAWGRLKARDKGGVVLRKQIYHKKGGAKAKRCQDNIPERPLLQDKSLISI